MVPTTQDQRTCNRCGSGRTRIIAQSISPPGAFVRCSDCGHSTLVPAVAAPSKGAQTAPTQFSPPQSDVDTRRVAHLVTTVIEARMLPHHVLGVDQVSNGWRVTIRTRVGDPVRFEIKADSMRAMRVAIEHALLAQA